MKLVAVTGTDGKSTTINLIHQILQDYYGNVLLISTINIKFGTENIPNITKMTSLDPMQLHKYLAIWREKGCIMGVLEVSSHALEQSRFEDVEFDLGVLTNITPEHLDYHKNMENYSNAKKKLFTGIIKNSKPEKMAVFPRDSEYWRRWREDLFFDKVVDFGIINQSDVRAEDISESISGTDFVLKYLGKTYDVHTRLLWKHNVYNILSAISAGILMGVPLESIIKSMQSFEGLPWRLERIEVRGVHYFVDFAHTPNALESVLSLLTKVKWTGKVICVFGAPWNRDKFKRPKMWQIASSLADVVIVTDDDPDTENRYKIIEEIVSGIDKTQWESFHIIPWREYAIKFASSIAKPGDIILLAGKGHEQVQLTNFGKRAWSDKEFVLSLGEGE